MNPNNHQPQIDVLIPAHNESLALPSLLEEIDRQPLRNIVVVDNASTDATAAVARKAGCTVISCPRPGYGSACLAGLAHLKKDPPQIVVFLDGDRSDFPSKMGLLFNPILQDDWDFVLGSRTLGKREQGSLNFAQRFGNALATRLMNFFWGTSYSDLGPFRAIRWSSLQTLQMTDTNFGWTIEMQIKAAVWGLRVKEVPVDYRNRIGISKISGTLSGCIRAGYKIIYTIFKYRFFKQMNAQTNHSQRELP